jgi:hypothetical protein
MRRFSKKSPTRRKHAFAQAIAPEAPGITRAAALTVIAGLAWPAMAAAVATTFGRLVEGRQRPPSSGR